MYFLGQVDKIEYENMESITFKKWLKSGELETIYRLLLNPIFWIVNPIQIQSQFNYYWKNI